MKKEDTWCFITGLTLAKLDQFSKSLQYSERNVRLTDSSFARCA